MRLRRRLTALLTAGLAAGGTIALAPPAGAEAPPSLASILLADGDEFDRNPYDFDIVTQAVLTVLEAKPDSPVGLLTQGDVELTAMIPNDRAFQVLVGDLTGKYYGGFFKVNEPKVFEAVKGLGVDTVENVLLYHVVPGPPIDSNTAANVAPNTPLNTALAGTQFRVRPVVPAFKWVVLNDNDPNDIDPFLVPSKLDINKGNPQIAHGIAFVLRPADL
jgi:hypothetical protein